MIEARDILQASQSGVPKVNPPQLAVERVQAPSEGSHFRLEGLELCQQAIIPAAFWLKLAMK